jgi:hypothetical protein
MIIHPKPTTNPAGLSLNSPTSIAPTASFSSASALRFKITFFMLLKITFVSASDKAVIVSLSIAN